MDKRDMLRSVLNNMIDNNQEQASLDMHAYLTQKMKEVAGLGQPQVDSGTQVPESDDDESATA